MSSRVGRESFDAMGSLVREHCVGVLLLSISCQVYNLFLLMVMAL